MSTPWNPDEPTQPGYGQQPTQPGYGQPGYGQPGYAYGGGQFPPSGGKKKTPLIIGAVMVAVALIGSIFVATQLLGGGRSEQAGDVDSPRDIADVDLAVGNCLESLDYTTNGELHQVPCADTHGVEVVADDIIADADFAGEDAYSSQGDEFCSSAVGDVLPGGFDTANMSFSSLYPSQATWDAGDRKIACLIIADAGYQFSGSFTGGDVKYS